MANHALTTRRFALLGAAVSSTALAVPASHAAHLLENPSLLRAGAEFERLWAIENAAKPSDSDLDGDWSSWEMAYNDTGAVVRQIVGMSAYSVRGLKIKARAIEWCYGADIIALGDNEATDTRMANSLVRDLLAIT